MAIDNTSINLKRTILKIPGDAESKQLTTEQAKSTLQAYNEGIGFGELLFVDNTNKLMDSPYHAYLLAGTKQAGENAKADVKHSAVFKAFNSKDTADRIAFYDSENDCISDESGKAIPTSKINAKTITESDLSTTATTKYHILVQPNDDSQDVAKFDLSDAGFYISANAVLNGGAWNDYAEFIKSDISVSGGSVVCATNEGIQLSSEKLQACPYVVSDTYGTLIGNSKDSIPVATSGKVLVKIENREKVKLGDCVCAGKDGCASIMTREEIINYPDRMLGVIYEIPNYETWGTISVDNRVWIRLK